MPFGNVARFQAVAHQYWGSDVLVARREQQGDVFSCVLATRAEENGGFSFGERDDPGGEQPDALGILELASLQQFGAPSPHESQHPSMRVVRVNDFALCRMALQLCEDRLESGSVLGEHSPLGRRGNGELHVLLKLRHAVVG
jgi:hypothetical protein